MANTTGRELLSKRNGEALPTALNMPQLRRDCHIVEVQQYSPSWSFLITAENTEPKIVHFKSLLLAD